MMIKRKEWNEQRRKKNYIENTFKWSKSTKNNKFFIQASCVESTLLTTQDKM